MNFMDASRLADPYPDYVDWRADRPIWWAEDVQGWVVSRYDDVRRILKDPAGFSSRAMGEMQEQAMALPLLSDDPPRHTQLRAIVNKAFTSRTLKAMEAEVAAMVDEHLDRLDPPTSAVAEGLDALITVATGPDRLAVTLAAAEADPAVFAVVGCWAALGRRTTTSASVVLPAVAGAMVAGLALIAVARAVGRTGACTDGTVVLSPRAVNPKVAVLALRDLGDVVDPHVGGCVVLEGFECLFRRLLAVEDECLEAVHAVSPLTFVAPP